METAEEFLGGLTSLYLGKGRLWSKRGYGVYATTDRIIGVKLGPTYLILSQTLLAIGLAIVLAVRFVFLPISSQSLLFPLFYALPLLLIILSAVLIPSVAEERLERKNPKTIKELEGRKYFEFKREEISEIEVKRPRVLSAGHLLVKLRTGEAVKVRIFGGSLRRNEYRLLKMTRLMQSFCGKEPLIRTLDLTVWAL